MNAYRIAELLVDMAKNGEDGTISVSDGLLPTSGYWVGGEKPSLVFDSVSEVDRGEIAWWAGNGPKLSVALDDQAVGGSYYYGVWVDSDTGKVYFDAVTHMNYEEYAVALGMHRGEIAIWDIAAGQEVRVAREGA